MKHFIYTLAIFLVINFSATACDKEKTIDFNDLPEKAQTFIKNNFPNASCTSIILDQEGTDKEYKVHLNEGTFIEFDKKGNWEDIQNIKGVDSKFLPTAAAEYIKTNYAENFIIEISYDSNDIDAYEVKLNNLLELKFTKTGEFYGMDM